MRGVCIQKFAAALCAGFWKLRGQTDRHGHSYADIISVRPDLLPGYDKKIKAFFEEHIHCAEEIRYILDGSGHFDIRDKEDKWIRIWIKKGDLMTLPEGCHHRFACDQTDHIQAMRLFKGVPVWTPFNRPQEDHPSHKHCVRDLHDSQGGRRKEGQEPNRAGKTPHHKRNIGTGLQTWQFPKEEHLVPNTCAAMDSNTPLAVCF